MQWFTNFYSLNSQKYKSMITLANKNRCLYKKIISILMDFDQWILIVWETSDKNLLFII